MNFNSTAFLLFFVIFFLVYWFVFGKNVKKQNIFLLFGSYVFYAWCDWRFLSLLAISTGISYWIGLKLPQLNFKHKKILLRMGILSEILILIFFKYTNFFINSFIDLFEFFNIQADIYTLQIILPLGISFYIFRSLGYILDIYYEKMKPESAWITYFTYIAYFPSLLNGPIDRGKLLIPQLREKRTFTYDHAVNGIKQILWGLFKKMVIADNCAEFVNQTFAYSSNFYGSTLLLGAFLYTIQLYADFSGYCDIGFGISNLLGIRITRNFNFPFFAQNIADYWKKWHISLTNWLTDFIFTPSSIYFRNLGKVGLIISIIITFLVSGIWHGPNWTFVLWGFLHGCYFIPLILKGTMSKNKKLGEGMLPSFRAFRNMLGMFMLIMFTNIIFRSASISQAINYFSGIFSLSFFKLPLIQDIKGIISILILIVFFIIVEWIGRDGQYAIEKIGEDWTRIMRWAFYAVIVFLIGMYMYTGGSAFIYYQF